MLLGSMHSINRKSDPSRKFVSWDSRNSFFQSFPLSCHDSGSDDWCPCAAKFQAAATG